MNKIPITTPNKDSQLKYLQIIREKEESIEALKMINDQLKKDNDILRLQIFESSDNEKRKIRKLEENNNQLKNMLKEAQNYVLQYQNDLSQFQRIAELLISTTQIYKFNQKATLEQIIDFLSKEVYSQELIDLWMELKEILTNVLKNTTGQYSASLNNIFHKYFQNQMSQYHPLSTKAIFEQIINLIQEVNCLELKPNTLNYSDQFQKQCQKINLFETSFVMINYEEELLRQQIQNQQKKLEKFEAQIEDLKVTIANLQEQEAMALQKLEQKPHIDILSVQDLSSSSSEDENKEIEHLQQQLTEKDNQISKLLQNVKNIEIKLEQLMMSNQTWDLIIDCTNDSLTSIYHDGWTLHFKHEFGLSTHQLMCSFYGMDSSYLQFVLENIFNNDFNFQKLPSQQYFQLGNNQLLYLKQIMNNDLNILIQTKVLNQQVDDFYASNYFIEGKNALSEFFIQYSLQNGILFLCLNNLDQQNEILLENALQIKRQYEKSVLIIMLNEENLGQESVQQICSKYSLTLYSEEIDDPFVNILLIDYDNFNFDTFIQKIPRNEMQNYLQNLHQFFTTSLPQYFTKEENAQLEIKQSISSDSIYEMKVVQHSGNQSIKLKINRQSQIIKEKEHSCLKKSDSQYEVIFPQKLEEVRLKSYIMKDKGILIRLKCQFDDDNLTTKEYILKSIYQENNENEISYTILDNKLALQL